MKLLIASLLLTSAASAAASSSSSSSWVMPEHSTNEDQSTNVAIESSTTSTTTNENDVVRPHPIVNPSDSSQQLAPEEETQLTSGSSPQITGGGLRPNDLSKPLTSSAANHHVVDGTNKNGEEDQSIVIPVDNDTTGSTSNENDTARPPIVNPSDSEMELTQPATTELTQAQPTSASGSSSQQQPVTMEALRPLTPPNQSSNHHVDGTNGEDQSIVIPADSTSNSNIPGYQRPTLTTQHDLQLDQTIMPSARPSSAVVAEDRSSSSISSSSSSSVNGWEVGLIVACMIVFVLFVAYFLILDCRLSSPSESTSSSDDGGPVTTSSKKNNTTNTTTNCSVMSGSSDDDTDGDSDDSDDDKDRSDGV